MEPLFDLTCWYIHWRRVAELVGVDRLGGKVLTIPTTRPKNDELEAPLVHAAFKSAVLSWLRSYEVHPVERQLIRHELRVGSRFTCYRAFYCHGLAGLSMAHPPPENVVAEIHARIHIGNREHHLRISYRPAYLWSATAFERLSGRNRFITLAEVSRIGNGEVVAEALVIADLHPADTPTGYRDYDALWRQHGEVHVDDIDSFDRVKREPFPPQQDLQLLKSVSEEQVKKAFAEIVSEPSVPADWGGERSDLFTSHVWLLGGRVSAAFLFKGPSQFRRMTFASLGKKGDQIERLFSEPAELLVVQHCHEIDTAIRSTARAFANSTFRPRSFCVIDGYDTLRILRAYGKCGFSPSEAK